MSPNVLIDLGGQIVDAASVTVPSDRQYRDAWILSADVIGYDLAMLKDLKKKEINAQREALIYEPIGALDLRGDGTLMVEPDIRHSHDRDNLVALHTRALSLKDAGVTAAAIVFGAADNLEYPLTPDEMLAVAEAPFDRAAALYQIARNKKADVDQLGTVEAVMAYDIMTGWTA